MSKRLFKAPGLQLGPIMFLLFILFAFSAPNDAAALPAYARKYNLRCNVCHTREPRLNPFGEKFMENGYQLPGTEDGGLTGKINLGPVSLDPTRYIMAVRMRAQALEWFKFTDKGSGEEFENQLNIAAPDILNILFAGTLKKNISYFFELEGNVRHEEFGLERGFFILNNLGGYNIAGLRVGKFDPSPYFSYPTHRQFLLPIQPKVEEGEALPGALKRAPLVPNAFAVKFFGLFDGEGNGLLPLLPFFFNSPAELGIDLHGRPFGPAFLYQVGMLQGGGADVEDFNQEKDFYFMGRVDLGSSNFLSGSVSAFYYMANSSVRVPGMVMNPDTGMMQMGPGEFGDVTRWGIGANVRWKMLDLYGAYIADKVESTDKIPMMMRPNFDEDAWGLTVELDILAREWLMLSTRFDHMNAGGMKAVKANNTVLGLQAKFYPVDNFGFIIRNDINLEDDGVHPLQRTRNSFMVGAEFAL